MADLLTERRGHVALLTLNRPERLNAITFAMLEALAAALTDAERDPDVRVIVLTGAGRGFCSGLAHHVLMQLMLLVRSHGFQEGVSSFIERRAPRFAGR